jgi:class 3 adenylate cyclase
VKTRNLAIVFTDIKGFTGRTSKQTLEQNERLLGAHNALLAPIFRGLSGRIVKTIGDAFMVTFESPTQAVLAGLAVQDALWKYNQSAAEEAQLEVRVAINVGEVRLEGNDVFGEPVNIAARVEGVAEAQEVTFTEAVYLAMNRAGLDFEDLGPFELKGIPEKVRLFRVKRVAASAALPPFGNLGLSRVAEVSGRQRALELAGSAGEVAARALESTSVAARGALESTGKLVESSLQSAERRGIPRRRALLLAGGAAAALVLLGVLLTRADSLTRAIDDAVAAKGEERSLKVEAVRKRIAQEKEPRRKSWYLGLLSEGLGEGSAADHYAAAARLGLSSAEGRLIELLRHPRCALRSAAADALADLQVTRSRSALESLAREGGADDGQQVLVFGCNSKQAAATALKRLKD